MPSPVITESVIRKLASEQSFGKGYVYYEDGSVVKVWSSKSVYHAQVEGTRLYDVTISGKNGAIEADCTCPYDWGGICKHIVAAMLAICHDGKVKKVREETPDVKALVGKVDATRLKKFLIDALTADEKLLKDFAIFARGDKETDKTVDKYKNAVLAQFNKLGEWEDYYDDYYDNYESPVPEIVDTFMETAAKYAAQKNYKEAAKMYQGLADACIEAFREEQFEGFADDMHFSAREACKRISELAGQIGPSLNAKKPYLDYLVAAYHALERPADFAETFKQAVRTRDEAAYVLGRKDADFAPLVRLNLLITKGNHDEIIHFGEGVYREHTETTVPLAEFYLKHGKREKAIALAEETLECLQKNGKNEPYLWEPTESQKQIRLFLDRCYDPAIEYAKTVENLMMLLDLESEINHYRKLRSILRTAKEKQAALDRLDGLLGEDYDLLFKIYALEKDQERLLRLAGKSLRFDVFDHIVKTIRDTYPEECFELYKKKINGFLESVKKRSGYRQAAYWLRLMKQIPGRQDKFRKYVEHLRTKYSKRSALKEEIKSL